VSGHFTSSNDTLRRATSEAFESWLVALADDLREAGVNRDSARHVSLAAVSLLEGALLLSRTKRSTEPMDAARKAAVALVEDAVPTPRAA
jgi:hypothetical protein